MAEIERCGVCGWALADCVHDGRTPRWICFHCEFETSDRADAEAHFGDRDDDTEFVPICKWWATMSAGERIDEFQSVLRDIKAEQEENGELIDANRSLQAENAVLRTALEEMEAEFRATPVTIQRVPRKIKLLASAWEALKADIATPALSSEAVAAEVERQQVREEGDAKQGAKP